MYGGHWSSRKVDISYSICHVTSQDLIIKGSCNFMDGSSSLNVTSVPILVAIGIVVVEI